MNLAQRSVTSSIYNIAANVIGLARLLEPEAFGVFAFVTSVVQLTVRCSSSRARRSGSSGRASSNWR
jgi:O-antigen/teichoic acid export membrane protein